VSDIRMRAEAIGSSVRVSMCCTVLQAPCSAQLLHLLQSYAEFVLTSPTSPAVIYFCSPLTTVPVLTSAY
jgi:hypothetical protein